MINPGRQTYVFDARFRCWGLFSRVRYTQLHEKFVGDTSGARWSIWERHFGSIEALRAPLLRAHAVFIGRVLLLLFARKGWLAGSVVWLRRVHSIIGLAADPIANLNTSMRIQNKGMSISECVCSKSGFWQDREFPITHQPCHVCCNKQLGLL